MPAKSVKDYFAATPQPHRATLEKMRADILAACPDAEEVLSYGMPTFKRGPGYGLVCIAAFKHHCSLFPMSSAIVRELGGVYATSKGTLQFPPDKPPPGALVKKIVKARLAEVAAQNAARAARKAAKKSAAQPARNKK